MEEPIKEWVFTFGYDHPHHGHYVRIKGTCEEARQEMFRRYGEAWCWQYTDEEWDSWLTDPKCKHIPKETELVEEVEE